MRLRPLAWIVTVALAACGGDVAGRVSADVGHDGVGDSAAIDGVDVIPGDSDGAADGAGGDAGTVDADDAKDVVFADTIADEADSATDSATDSAADSAADSNAGAPGDADAATLCDSALVSIAQMPISAEAVSFELCAGCPCCNADGSYPAEIPIACLQCAPAAALASVGGTLQGGMLTTMVGCVSGNPDAPMANRALFVGGGVKTSAGTGLIVDFAQPVTMFGFSAVSTASVVTPTVTLRGFDAQNTLVAEDSFAFASAPGGSCATLNPAVQFFGFRPCFSATMSRVEVEVSDGNVAIDEVRVVRP